MNCVKENVKVFVDNTEWRKKEYTTRQNSICYKKRPMYIY